MKQKLSALISVLALAFALSACSSPAPELEAGGKIDTSKGSILGVDRNSDVEISYVYTKYMDDIDTRSIGEALTGDEYTHGFLTLRSQPKAREGMYFFVMLDWAAEDIAMGCQIELSVDSTASALTRSYNFTVPATHSLLREIKLGLTGSDWKGRNDRVNAWKIVIKTPSGKVIIQKQSWLWSLREDGKVEKK